MKDLKEKLCAKIAELAPLAFALSDGMAHEPELGLQEYKSSAAIVALLREHGIEVEYPFAGYETGFCGHIAPERKQRMALLAEYDALRGLGHACGHCASGSASALAALAFQALKDEYSFGVDIIGTPDEEYSGAKAVMAKQGVFGEILRKKVLKMAANVETMMYVREKPWHGLGVEVSEAPNSEDALRFAGLDWNVRQENVFNSRGGVIKGFKAT